MMITMGMIITDTATTTTTAMFRPISISPLGWGWF